MKSIELLKSHVLQKCELRFGGDVLEVIKYTKIHEYIIKQVIIQLEVRFSKFCEEGLAKKDLAEREKFIVKTKEKYASPEFSNLFSAITDWELLQAKVESCIISDERITRKFFNTQELNDETILDKSKDFYCAFLGWTGWNDWYLKFDKEYLITGNSNANEITYRFQLRKLPKKLNMIPEIDPNDYVLREEVVENLFMLSESTNKKVSITGISGMGKTFLVKHFIQNYFDLFNHIVWLDCSQGLLHGITNETGAELMDNLGLKNDDPNLLNLAVNRLRKMKGTNLMILDNIDESSYDYDTKLSLGKDWKIIATSQKVLDGFDNFPIPSFLHKSTLLFYKHYSIERDDNNLIRLLSAFEFHTLTVELLAKTAQQRSVTILELIKRFTRNGINVVEKARIVSEHSKERGQTIENIEDYLNIIFDTSELSTEEFKILLNLALIQGHAISTELFVDVYLSGSKDIKEVDVVYGDIDILSKKGWISKDNNKVLLHNLIKGVFLKKSVNEDSLSNSIIEYLIYCLQEDDFTQALKYFLLLENILDNTSNLTLSKNMVGSISAFYNLLGLHHKSLELYSAYFPLALEALDFENLNNYAYRFKCLGKNYDALNCYYKIYEHFDNHDPDMDYVFGFFQSFCFGERQPSTIGTIEEEKSLADEMSNLLLGLMLFVENVYHIGEVYAIEKTWKEHKDAVPFLKDAQTYENALIKGLESYLEKQEEYEAFSKESLDICKNSYALINNRLGTIYLDSRQYEMSFSLFEESLKINEELFGQYSPRLLENYQKLFGFYIGSLDIENATKYLEKYNVVCEKLPDNHPEKGYQVVMKTKLYWLNNSLIIKQEKELENSVHDLFEKVLTESNQNKNYTDLGWYYSSKSSIYEKFQLFEKALQCSKKHLIVEEYSAGQPIQVASIKVSIASFSLNLGEYQEGIKQINEALEIYRNSNLDDEAVITDTNLIRQRLFKFAFGSGDKGAIIQEIKQRLLHVFETPDYVKEKGVKHEAVFKNLWISYLLSEVSSENETISIPLLPLHKNRETALKLQITYLGIVSVTLAEFEIFNEAIKYLKLKMQFGQKYFPDDLISDYISNISLAKMYVLNNEHELANQFNKNGIDGLIDFLTDNPQHSDIQLIKHSLNIGYEIQNEIEKELERYRM